ncbi:FecCD family ABC transporter permease [Embleya sp. NPDC050493]|uniref:FecCD family ABC transporter permease n=1 Tax=Embleya sp. NPDC050493 TaxID=3363989 RepID=UPI0037905B4C
MTIDRDPTAARVAILRGGGPPAVPGPGRPVDVPGRRVRLPLVVGALLVALFAAATAGLLVGSVPVPWSETWRILAHRIGGDAWVQPSWSRAHDLIIADTRLPRVLLAAVVGATLAVVGMVIQAIVRNPLAGPDVLGVSAGAAGGAVLVMRWGVASVGGLSLGALTLNAAAFGGGLITLLVVFSVARSGGRVTAVRLVLAGVAVSAVLSSLTSLLVLTSPDPQLAAQVLFWTLGGFGSARWTLLLVPALALALGLVVLLLQARNLNLLLAGEESAAALGLDVQRFRQGMFLLAAVLTGVVVAVSGVIGFVGLMLPHVVRLLVGADHRRALPVAALLGAVFAICADLVARTVLAPQELPVGIVTSLVGGPFFVWLLRRDARREAGAR